MKYLITIFFIIFLSSCKNDLPKTIDFDLIDISMYNGWTDYYSFKIFKDARIYVYNNRFRKGESYFKASLGQKEMDSISKMVKLIYSNKPSPFYHVNCADCGMYNLIIKFKGVKFSSFVHGDFDNDKRVVNMNHLVRFLSQIGGNSMKSFDSVFKFESKTREFYPPPLPPPMGSD